MAFHQAMSWHEGEDKIHKLTRLPASDNPTHPMLPQMLARRVALSPTIALGTTDDQGRIWCTIWGGDVPIAQQVAQRGVIGVRTQVDASFDPVVQALYGGSSDGEVVQHNPKTGKMISGLGIHLEDRDRVKLFGRMLAGSLSADDAIQEDEKQGKTGNAQLVFQVTQSLGNCPKYINKKSIKSYPDARPRLLCDSPLLTPEAISHVHSADIFFIASRGPEDMDCNNRGGPRGFLRVAQSSPSTSSEQQQSSVLVWPEYSGNNLYQTLGNLIYDPHAGIVIPNFITGDVLYLTGTAEILLNAAATAVIAKTKLAVRFTVTAARFVADGLCFRGTPSTDNRDVSSSHPVSSRTITDGMSPYNPRVRYLTSELDATTIQTLPPDEYRDRHISSARNEADLTAILTEKTKLTPTITKYRFRLSSKSDLPTWTPGQYVALDFSDELYMGYSHMRDDDPTSLNDDFIRTFTVASLHKPPSLSAPGSTTVDFEIILRTVGTVTRWLTHQNARGGMTKVAVQGFDGDFRFKGASATGNRNVFIAAGVGITPLLGQAVEDLEGLVVLWTVNVRDIGLVSEIVGGLPEAARRNMRVFVTGTASLGESHESLKVVRQLEEDAVKGGAQIVRRRLTREDVLSVERDVGNVEHWYLCAAPRMRLEVQEWLSGKTVVFENFDY